MKYQLGTALIDGRERVILHYQDVHIDLQSLLSSGWLRQEEIAVPTTMMQMMEQWLYWKEQLSRVVASIAERNPAQEIPGSVPVETLGWLPPLLYPRKLICIGTNYRDHIAEMSGGTGKAPERPYSFLKPPTTTLIGSDAILTLPDSAKLIDWEVELAVIIGQRVHNVHGDDVMACIAGYSVINDISARDWITQPSPVGIDWVMSKALDGFAPMGPYITPAEFVPDPQNLRLSLAVNGQIKQDSTTANMVFGVREIVEHLAAFMTLEPGDVIATGTPAGVGFGRKPPELLKAGDYMVAEVEGLGRLETYVR